MTRSTAPPLAPLLRKLEYWGKFSAGDRHALLALPHTLKRVPAQRYLVREHDRATHCCLMRSGFAYRHKIVGDGARQILSIHLPGDMVDLQNALLGVADHSAQALTAAEIAFIPRGAIKAIALSHPAIGQAMWHDTLVDGAISREWVANVGRRDSRTRIAHLLCEFAMRLDAAGLGKLTDYELPMTQEQLADCTGLTPVHVNRTLKLLREDGFIGQSTRSVTIENWTKLAKTGDFEGGYLHMDEDKLELLQ